MLDESINGKVEAHAPHSQSEAEEEEAMIRGLWVLVVTVVWGVVRAGFVCAARPCCFVRLTYVHKCTKKSANHGILGIAGKLSMLDETNQTITFN
jgi:hypothetical protein